MWAPPRSGAPVWEKIFGSAPCVSPGTACAAACAANAAQTSSTAVTAFGKRIA
jgi:hypothetical protein